MLNVAKVTKIIKRGKNNRKKANGTDFTLPIHPPFKTKKRWLKCGIIFSIPSFWLVSACAFSQFSSLVYNSSVPNWFLEQNCYRRWCMGPFRNLRNKRTLCLSKNWRKFKRTFLIRKYTATVFWNQKGVLLGEFRKRGMTITATFYVFIFLITFKKTR